jgi:H/ACA ribonucleoprotein complex subunit 1
MVKFIHGGSRGGGRPSRDEGPPEEFIEVGEVIHSSEGNQLLCKCTVGQVPWFSKSVYLESRAEIGTVDEVLGPVSDFVRNI